MLSDYAAWAGVIVAICSLIVAILAFIKGSSAQSKILDIEQQRDQERREYSKKALLRTEMRKDEKNIRRLFIINDGESEARSIKFKLDGIPLSEISYVPNNPPELIAPRSEASILLILTRQDTPPSEISVTWDDDSGNDNFYRNSITW